MLRNHAESSRFRMILGNLGVLKYLESRIPRFLGFWGFSVTESCGILKIPHDSWKFWGTQVSIVKNSQIPGNLGIQRYAILGFLTILPYKAAYLSAIRIIEIDFDTKDKNEILTFENKKFKKVASGMEIVKEIGLYMGDKSVRNNKRMAIFFPQEGLLCFLRSYSSYSSNGVTYRIMRKKKRETP